MYYFPILTSKFLPSFCGKCNEVADRAISPSSLLKALKFLTSVFVFDE